MHYMHVYYDYEVANLLCIIIIIICVLAFVRNQIQKTPGINLARCICVHQAYVCDANRYKNS